MIEYRKKYKMNTPSPFSLMCQIITAFNEFTSPSVSLHSADHFYSQKNSRSQISENICNRSCQTSVLKNDPENVKIRETPDIVSKLRSAFVPYVVVLFIHNL